MNEFNDWWNRTGSRKVWNTAPSYESPDELAKRMARIAWNAALDATKEVVHTYYVTTGSGMPDGSGYYEIHAASETEARDLAFKHCPDGRWAFMYFTLEDVHPADRRCHGKITGTIT